MAIVERNAARREQRCGPPALVLAAGAVVLAATAVVALRGASNPTLAPPPAGPGHAVCAVVARPDALAATAATTPTIEPVAMARIAVVLPAAGAHGAVVVRGRITIAGTPVPRADLSFFRDESAVPGPATDWCVADRFGRYEVELPPGGYAVRSADRPGWQAALAIAPGVDGVTADWCWEH